MKGKTSLALMEQAIMLLVLAIAAALCLRAFAWSDTRSLQNSSRDRALAELQSAAEVLKSCQGDYTAAAETFGGEISGKQWVVFWDENWVQSQAPGVYQLCATPQSPSVDYLGCAALEIVQPDGTSLCNLQVCWQEVQP